MPCCYTLAQGTDLNIPLQPPDHAQRMRVRQLVQALDNHSIEQVKKVTENALLIIHERNHQQFQGVHRLVELCSVLDLIFYWIGERGKAMLGIWEKEPAQIIRQHFAFHTTIDHMKHAVPFLQERGLPVRNFLNDGTERPFVFAWMPAVSIYFADPDGHSLEFLSMLPDKPQPELGVVPWEEWEMAHGRQVDW